jgi:hypothetical protein
MPTYPTNYNLPQTLLGAAQIILQAKRLESESARRDEEFALRTRMHEELMSNREKLLDLREQTFQLQSQREARLQAGQDERLKIQGRAQSLREAKAQAEAGKGTTAGQALRARKLQLQLLEEDAAMRVGAPEEFWGFSDSKALVNERNRLTSFEQQSALSPYPLPEAETQLKAARARKAAIDKELIERGRYKRDALIEAGEPTTLEMSKQYLPDMTDEPVSATPQPVGATLDAADVPTLEKAIGGALGKDPEFTPDASIKSFRSEVQRLRGLDPTGGQAQSFKRTLFRTMVEKHGMTKEQSLSELQKWGLP